MKWRYVMTVALAVWLGGCSEAPVAVEVDFIATYAGANPECDSRQRPTMTDLRFYVHNLRLEDANGQWHPVQLIPGQWQQADLALIDLEDGSGNCINGTTVTNSTVRGTVRGQDFRALEFTLGVPFGKNHADPLQATPPLGDADMHWHWRGGYKFLRAGLKSELDSFWIHLGSTGCAGTIRNISGCKSPNRVMVRLEPFTPGDDILVDLVALAGDDVLGDGVPTECSSGPAEEDCRTAFEALGLNHATGTQDGRQRLFSLRRAP